MDAVLLERIRTEPDRSAAARLALEHQPGWYHTMDLLPGVATPGFADLRPLLARALPADLSGRRCLDVGTFDGFYAFAMEDRGAGEVVGIDVVDPEELEHPPLHREGNLKQARESKVMPGDGFHLAAAVRRSSARWLGCNVRHLTPEAIGGRVDFAVVGTILQHLRDPVGALERVRDTLRPGGEAVLIETISVPATLKHPRTAVAEFRPARPGNRYSWWVPNLAALKAWPAACGLEVAPGRPYLYRLPRQAGVGRGDWLAAVRVTRPDLTVPAQAVDLGR
ncbi:MAG: hypothetical protein JWM02_2386 [Frankiales bacterium]|nr:hypothetical protein [Frankiales bacterium]